MKIDKKNELIEKLDQENISEEDVVQLLESFKLVFQKVGLNLEWNKKEYEFYKEMTNGRV